jgi:hypothetical protein
MYCAVLCGRWWAYSSSRRLATAVLGRGEDEAVYVDGFAGMCAGVSETVLVHPFDSVRARIMTGASKETRYFHALHHVCKTEGFRVRVCVCECIYRCVIYICRSLPVSLLPVSVPDRL